MCEYKYTHTYISIVIFSPPSVSIYIKLEKNIYANAHLFRIIMYVKNKEVILLITICNLSECEYGILNIDIKQTHRITLFVTCAHLLCVMESKRARTCRALESDNQDFKFNFSIQND